MSRSFQKRPFCSMVCCNSQKKAKRIGNRAMRRTTRTLIRDYALDDEDLLLPINMDEIMDVWSMPKDGVSRYYSYRNFYIGRINGWHRRFYLPIQYTSTDFMIWYRMVMMK